MKALLALPLALTLASCATAFEEPRNTVDLTTQAYTTARRPMTNVAEVPLRGQGRYGDLARCADADLPMSTVEGLSYAASSVLDTPPLSPGDMLRLSVPAGEMFNGSYIIAADGHLSVPHLPPVPAAGFSVEVVEALLAEMFIEAGLYRAGFLQIDLDVAQWAPVQVYVSGAVFQPGDQFLNDRQADAVQGTRVDAQGDISSGRTLISALSAASGLRPDADVRHVVLVRDGQRQIYDMSGAFSGQRVMDPLLAAGDQIHVPSRGCFQEALARPSRVTIPGIRVFMSNLTTPASSNSQSAINRDTTSLPYGTRFLQALVTANCVGGTQATNADRWAVLISRNPVTGESEVIARSIEGLVRRADRDAFNPILLPGDAIACYDSHVTNVRDVISAFSGVLNPAINLTILSGASR
ncbi:hypothetical protein [Maricaulis sp.]|uniref:polysaccharide biosynthesis/export family protein n=1 Tax=unclassified Maricaulis TaxID=2632371 RepID=UPI001B1FF582|nr:hypothetical protein [Maricaulis sp.]MBO6798546.1 hypothetical protein [Maricaulis sp.]